MSGTTENSIPSAEANRKKIKNRLFFYVGLVPFIPFGLLALPLRDAHFLLGPIVGFVPVEFFHPRTFPPPPPEQVHFWFWTAGILFSVFAILAFFIRRLGLLFALAMWASSATLLLRIYLRAKAGPIFEQRVRAT
jgi:hypothetical protein